MGEYAEMMLDGTLCECCGEYIGRSTGFPGYCSRQCAEDRGYHDAIERNLGAALAQPDHKCPTCSKGFRSHKAMRDHMATLGHDPGDLRQCSCGRLCKGERGLRDHQAAKGCNPRPVNAGD